MRHFVSYYITSACLVSHGTDRFRRFDFNRSMPDPQSRIRRYQQRAEECLEIAEGLGDGHLRSQYMRVAETYLRLVEIELRGLEDGIAIREVRGPRRRPADTDE